MILVDVNVLVHAYREDSPHHTAFRSWLIQTLDSGAPLGLADLALSGFLRITTHPNIFDPPSPLDHALGFVEMLRTQPSCTILTPGPRHWQIFTQLCRATGAKGNFIPDAFFAAMAIEADAEWITADRRFNRFPGLRWRHPLS